MRDTEIAVIGGGIAGLTAALTAARQGRAVTLLASGLPGGELLNIERIDGIPGHEGGIGGYELCPMAEELAHDAGAQFAMEAAERLVPEGADWLISTGSGDIRAGAVILAMGARPLPLGIPGEEDFAGHGLSRCASCDGPLLAGKVAAVAGGGDSAMQEALTLAQHAARVIVIARDGLTGQAAYRRQIEADPRIEVLAGCEIAAIEGAGKVERIRIQDRATGTEREVAVEGVFPFVGLEPNLALAAGLVALGRDGRIAVDAQLRASASGIFAAGNVRSGNGWRAVGAMGDGATAAIGADLYLAGRGWCA